MEVKIRKDVLEIILEGARNAYPNEFFAILFGDEVIEGIYIIKIESGRNFVRFLQNSIPLSPKILGTVHSHLGAAKPSPQDLDAFRRLGKIHLIVRYPFRSLEDVVAFSGTGERVRICVVK